MFDMVPSLLLYGSWKLRYDSFCRYIPSIFLFFFSLNFSCFINIREKLNLMCYKLDHFFKHAVSKHSFKIRFGTIVYLTTEI